MDSRDAVIFDMDGVLIDSEPVHYEATNGVLREEGHALTWEKYVPYIGTVSMEMWRELCDELGLRATPEACEARQGELFLRALPGRAQATPGALRLVDSLREGGARLGLASSSARPWIEGVLSAIGLAGAFEVVVSADDVARGKPDPEIFLLAAKRLGVLPAACTVIEDSRHGVAAALAAGMAVVAVRTAYNANDAFTGVQRVVASLEELAPAE